MDNNFTEITTTTYGQNVKNSFFRMVFGIILFFASFILLWWNEGNSVRLIQKEDFINKNAIVANSSTINKNNDMKLIATNGSVYSDEILSDSMVTVDNVLNLTRTVEMYQWIEKKQTEEKRSADGGTTKTTTYSYEKTWDKFEHNSDKYKKTGYNNPKFTFKSKDLTVNEAKMGEFKLNRNQISRIGGYRNIEKLEPKENFKIIDNYYYKGNDYSFPEVGDIRISYKYVPSGANVSIIGQQNWDNSIGEMPTRSGSLYLQYDGILSLDEMLNKFKQTNMLLTFGLRFAGFFAMYIGLQLLVNPIIAIARFVPFLSEIVEFISSFILGSIAASLSLLTIAIAWLMYRPLLTISLFALIGLIIYQIKQYIQNKRSSRLIQQNSI